MQLEWPAKGYVQLRCVNHAFPIGGCQLLLFPTLKEAPADFLSSRDKRLAQVA